MLIARITPAGRCRFYGVSFTHAERDNGERLALDAATADPFNGSAPVLTCNVRRAGKIGGVRTIIRPRRFARTYVFSLARVSRKTYARIFFARFPVTFPRTSRCNRPLLSLVFSKRLAQSQVPAIAVKQLFRPRIN